MKHFVRFYLSAVLVTFVISGVACTNKEKPVVSMAKQIGDTEITLAVRNKFSEDSGLQDKNLDVETSAGTVTISGKVDNEVQRNAASRAAGAIDGVKLVINNVVVGQAQTKQAAETTGSSETKSASVARVRPQQVVQAAHTEVITRAQPMPTTPLLPPAPQRVTVPAGTSLSVRLLGAVDSERNLPGQVFTATLASPIAVDGDIVVPMGANIDGHVVQVQSAGKFAGRSLLVLTLDRMLCCGSGIYPLQTDEYRREGSSRGKNTAAKVGAGAGIGALIGALAGGGKGAAIGAAAGGGLGGGVQAATKGQQIVLQPETLLTFTLRQPITVRLATPIVHEQRPQLERPKSE